jgi:hypothetical protein
VDGQQRVGEAVHGRGDGEPEEGEAGEQGADAGVIELRRAGFADEDLAAQVDCGGDSD